MTAYLLDTQLVVWSSGNLAKLGDAAREILQDEENDFLFSSVVIWEISVKTALGRPDFDVDPRLLRRGLLENGATELPVTSDHGLAVGSLPPHHRDPFDRIQIAQARVEGILFLTSDRLLAVYGSPVKVI